MIKNIVLIGMPGAGKSTIGVLLAKTLGMNFTDTDIVIQQLTKRTLYNIIANDSIDKFLEIEENTVMGLKITDSIIATGGSVVYSQNAIEALKKDGIIVYLNVPLKELEHRLTDIVTRGVVIKPGATLADIFAEREPLYNLYSDITIDCEKLSTEQCVTAICSKIKDLFDKE